MQESLKCRKKKTLIKFESGSGGLKSEGVKYEDNNFGNMVKYENENPDELLEINYTKDRLPEFNKIPEDIIKNEMQRNGFKTCQVKKTLMF